MSERTFERIVIMLRTGHVNGHLVLHFDSGLLTYISLTLNGVGLYWEPYMRCVHMYVPDCCRVPIYCGDEHVDILLDTAERLIEYAYDVAEPLVETD